MEVGEEGDYIPIATRCPQTTIFLKRKESRSGVEPRSFRLPALSPFLIGRLFVREPSWEYSANLNGS